MSKYSTVFGDLLRHFEVKEFERAVYEHKEEHRARVLSCYDLFKSLIYALGTVKN
jgi:hypothetical protein